MAPKSTELERAARELDEMVKGETEAAKEPSVVDNLAATAATLAKATETLINNNKPIVKAEDEGKEVHQPPDNKAKRGGKDDDDDEEVDDEEPEDEGEGSDKSEAEDVREDFYKSAVDGDATGPVLEVSEALQELASIMGKSLSDRAYETRLLRHEVATLAGAIGVLVKSQLELHKRLAAAPVKLPQAGVVGQVNGERIPTGGGKPGDISKSELRDRLHQAISDGKLEAHWLAKMDSPGGPDWVLANVPSEIAKGYNIPRTTA